MRFTDEDIANYVGLPEHTVMQFRRKLQREGHLTPVQKRPLLLDINGAVRLCEEFQMDMNATQLKKWLQSMKNQNLPQEAVTVKTTWRNPKVLSAKLGTTGEVVTVRVKNAADYRVPAKIQIIPIGEYLWKIDPEWSPKKRKKSKKRLVNHNQAGA